MASIYTTNEPFDISLSNDISNDVIIIDTSENRIGVNIMDPHYSIDVRDFSDVSGIIYTDYLKTGAIISSLTPNTDVSYNLGSQDKKWNEIHANYLEVSGIKIKDASQFILGSGSGGDAIVFPSDISVNGDVSCVNLNVDGITIKDASKFSIGGGTSDTNGIEFMANTTITGDLTITGSVNSSYISSLLTGTNDVNVSVINNTILNNNDVYSKYKATNLLTSYTNQDVGFNPDYNRVFEVATVAQRYLKDPSWPVAASSEYHTGGWLMEYIMDNNITTKWIANSYTDSEWVIFDLGTPKNILGLKIKNEKFNLSEFTFEIGNSTDINNFTAIKTFNGILEDLDTNSSDLVTNEFILPYEITSRYIRLNNIKGANNIVPGFTEIEFKMYDIVSGDGTSYQRNESWPIEYSSLLSGRNYYNSYIMDGTYTTKWLFNNDGFSLNNWVKFDLKSPKTVLGLSVYVPKTRFARFSFEIGDAENGTYTSHQFFDNFLSNPESASEVPVYYTFNLSTPVTTRFIKLGNIRSATSGPVSGIGEISFNILDDVKYMIDNQLTPDLSLSYDTSYVFDLTNVSSSFPFNIYTQPDNSNNPYSGATIDGSFLYLTVDSDTSTLYYNSSQDLSMGGTINIIPSNYQNVNVKFISDTNQIVRTDLNEYNRFNLVSSDFNKSTTSSNTNLVSINGIIAPESNQYYNIRSSLNLDVVNAGSHDVSLDFVIFKNNNVIHSHTLSVNSDTTISNRDINLSLSQIKLLNNDTINLGFLTYIENSSASSLSLNSASGVSYKPLGIDLNFNGFYIEVDKFKPPASDYNYDINIKNNTILNNQDVYSKYKGDTLLSSYTNQDAGFNPDYNRVLNVKTVAQRYLQDPAWVHSVSSTYNDYTKDNIMDGNSESVWVANSIGASTDEWILFDFGKSQTIVGLLLNVTENQLSEITLETSNDGIDFSAITTFNINSSTPISSFVNVNGTINVYEFSLSTSNTSRYIRLNKIKGEGGYYGIVNDIKFKMNDNISNDGTSYQQNIDWPVSASYERSQLDQFGKHLVMDGTIDTTWATDSIGPHSITFNLQTPKTVLGLRIIIWDSYLNNFKVQYSNDGTTFYHIQHYHQFNQNTATTSTYTFNFTNLGGKVTAKYFRLHEMYGSGPVHLKEISFNILDDVNYLFDNQLTLSLSVVDTSYVFDLTDVSPSFPFNIYTDADSSNNPYSGATVDGSFLYLTVDSDTSTLYYNSSQNVSMGGQIDIINKYQNMNVKFIADTNNIVRSDLNEYNKFNLVTSDFNRVSTSGYVNNVDLCGVIISMYGDNYSINSLLNLDVTNSSSYDVSLDFVLLHNNTVIPNTHKTISVLANTTVTNQDISTVLSGVTLFENDTLNLGFLTYIEDSSASGLNSASAVSYQSLAINLNVNSLNISVEKLKPTTSDYNYDIAVINNTNLNNQDVYSKYKGDTLLTTYTNQDSGFNPDYNRVLKVVSGGISYQKDPTWPVEASSDYLHYTVDQIMDDNLNQWAVNVTGTHWVRFDLDEERTIIGFKITHEQRRISRFTFQTSSEANNNWNDIETFDLGDVPDNVSSVTNEFILSNAITARYIRLYDIKGIGSFFNYPGIMDMEFLVFDTTDHSSYQQNIDWPVSVSSQYNSDTGVQYTMDNLGSNTGWESTSHQSQWIIFNFQTLKTISGLKITMRDREVKQFTVQYSNNDGATFNTIESYSGFNGSGDGINTYTFNFTPVTTQYIRLNDIHSHSSSYNVVIRDLQFKMRDVKYLIDNQLTPDLSLSVVDTSYVFDLTSVSTGFPFNIYTDADSSNNPYSGATVDGSFLYLTVDSDTSTLYYKSSEYPDSGGQINIIPSTYQNMNVKFIADTNNIVRTDLNEYNKFNLVTSDFNKVSASGYVNYVDLCGVIIAEYGDNYNINSQLNLQVTNNSSYDVSLDFVLLQNNSVIPNTQKTISVLANTTVTNQEISSQLAGVTLYKNDTINLAFLTYIEDSSASGLNSASAVSYQSLAINLNVNSLNISVENLKPTPQDYSYDVNVINNTNLNNQDVYSKYKGDTLLTSYTKDAGFNPDYNRVLKVVSGGITYQRDSTWPVEASSEHSTYPVYQIMDGNGIGWSATSANPQWIRFDLKSPKTLLGLRIRGESRRFYQFTFQTSNFSNDSWVDIESFDLGDVPINGTNITTEFILSNIITSQYIRLNDIQGKELRDIALIELEFLVFDTTNTSNVNYLINNQLTPDLSLSVDTSYVFDLTDVSTGFPFNIYTDADSSNNPYSGATVDGSFLYLTVDSDTSTLYYNSSQNVSIGGQIDIIPSTYQNMNVKFIADTNQIVRTDLNEYNRFNLVSSDFNKSSASGYVNYVDLCGVIIAEYGQYYNINSLLNLDVTNTSSYDVSLDFVLLQNNSVIPNTQKTISVLSNTSVTNQDISSVLAGVTLFKNDTINYAFLTYIQDSSASGLNSASAVSYQSLGINLNVNSLNISVSAPYYEELQVSNLDANNINVDNINIKDTLTLNSDIPTSGDSIVFDGNKLTWKNAIIDVRELIINSNITQRSSNTAIGGATNEDRLGTSCAMSADGNRLIVGGGGMFREDGNKTGRVEIYDFSYVTNDWVKIFSIIGETSGANCGTSVDITPDGNTIIFGSCYNNSSSYTGYAEVYEYQNSTWVQKGQRLAESGFGSATGQSVSLSRDGNIVAVSAPKAVSTDGIIHVYEYQDDTSLYVVKWSTTGENDARFGVSLKLNDEGNVLVVGAVYTSINSLAYNGAVYIYRKNLNNDAWSLEKYIYGLYNNDELGYAVTLSADGNVVVGGTAADPNGLHDAGALMIYRYDGLNWNNIIGGNNYFYAGDHGGLEQDSARMGYFALSLSNNGDKLAAGGAWWDTPLANAGSVQVYAWNGSAYEIVNQLYGEVGGARFGASVALSDNGKYLAVGEPRSSNDQGRVFTYDLKTETIPSGSLYYNPSDYVLRIKP